MHLFIRTLSVIVSLAGLFVIDVAEGCSGSDNWKSRSIGATESGNPALTEDCINLADRFAFQWYNDPGNKNM